MTDLYLYLRRTACVVPALNRPVLTGMIIAVLIFTIWPAFAKSIVQLDANTELHYRSGWYNFNPATSEDMDIDISDVDIFEFGEKTGIADRIKLKTIGIGDDIAVIEQMIVKNFSYQSKEPIFLSVALIEAENLVIKEDTRSQKYRKTKFLDQNARSFAHLRNFLMVIEDAFIEVEIDQIRLDGILIPTRFDLLPDNARNDMTMNNLVIRQIAGDRTASPTDMFFQSLNSDHLTIDMDLSWEQEKQDNLLTFKNQLNLYAHDLFRLNAGLQMLFTQKEYDHLNQLTLALMQDANHQTEEALNIAAVQAITDLSVSLTDTGALSVYTTSQGERGAIQRNVFLSMMQLALLESVPAHAQAISGPVSDFLETGGTLSMQSKITPPLSATEIMQLPANIDLFLDRIGFIIRHTE